MSAWQSTWHVCLCIPVERQLCWVRNLGLVSEGTQLPTFSFGIPGNYPALESFIKLQNPQNAHFRKVLQLSGEDRHWREKKKKSTSTLAQPLPCCTMHCWFVDALCASPGSCVSPQGDTATHLVAAACCDPNCSSRTPEIASCLWERSAVADCFMAALSAVEVSKHALPDFSLPFFLLFRSYPSRGSALPPHTAAPGHETTSAQSRPSVTSNSGESRMWVKVP